MAKGHLKQVMLQFLSHEPLSGYDLMKRIHEQSGSWKPSFGSIYPNLKHMHSEGLLKTRKEGRRIIYSLTPSAKEQITNIEEESKELYKTLLGKCRAFIPMDDEFINMGKEILAMASSGKNPFSRINEEVIENKKALMRLWKKGLLKKNEGKIKKILKESTKAFNSLR